MTLPSYDIPQGEANVQALQMMAQANGEALRQVAVDAITPLAATISQNEQLLQYSQNTLRRSLGGKTAANNKRLNDVVVPLAQSLTAQTAVLQSQMAGVAAGALPTPQKTGAGGAPDLPQYGVFFDPATGCYTSGPTVLDWQTTPEIANLDLIFAFPTPGEAKSAEGNFNEAIGCGVTPKPPPLKPEPVHPPIEHVPEPKKCEQCCCCPCTCAKEPKKPAEEPEKKEAEYTPPAVGEPGTFSVPSIATCGLTQGGALPPVGSPEFCACLAQIRNWLRDVGLQAVDYIFGIETSDGGRAGGFLSSVATALLPIDDAPVVGRLGLGKRVKEIVDEMKPILGFITKTIISSPTCNPQEQIGVALARVLVRMFRKLTVGINFGVNVVVVLDVYLEQLETVINYVGNYSCPVEIPQVPEAIECILQGTVSLEQGACWLAMRGVDLSVWGPVLAARSDRLSPPERIQYMRRQGDEDEDIARELERFGWKRSGEAEKRVELYDELPTISDHLHWLTRNVFKKDYVEEFRLMDGFAEDFWPAFGKDLHSLGMKEKYAALHYAAHWINPSPGQLQEMVYRLRPGKEEVENTFTPEQYEKVLQEQDVGPFFRPRFKEILYQVPALTYLRDMHRMNLLTDEQMKSYHEDLGFKPEDSERFVQVDNIRKNRMRATEGHGWNPAALARAFQVGLVTEEFIHEQMKSFGYQPFEAEFLMERSKADLKHAALMRSISRTISAALAEVKTAQQAGVLTVGDAADAISALGYPAETATGIAQATDASSRVALVKQATLRIRSAYLHGEVDSAYAQQALVGLGIVPESILRFLSAWKIELTPRRKRRTALQTVDDLTAKLITEPEARAKLGNLGYDERDIELFLARGRLKEEAKQEKGLARGRSQRPKAPAKSPATTKPPPGP